jgi:hypothetical protein
VTRWWRRGTPKADAPPPHRERAAQVPREYLIVVLMLLVWVIEQS